jgi:hypothetical protein
MLNIFTLIVCGTVHFNKVILIIFIFLDIFTFLNALAAEEPTCLSDRYQQSKTG